MTKNEKKEGSEERAGVTLSVNGKPPPTINGTVSLHILNKNSNSFVPNT